MADREKVIEQLESMRDYHRSIGNNITADIANDAVKLLKEQLEIVRCAECRHGELDTEHFIRPSIVCKNPANGVGHVSHRPAWFCADGERKSAE